MKNISKETKGITLISLIITIIVLIILASIGTYSGIDVIRSSKFTAFSTELKIMQTQINNFYQKYKNNETVIVDETIYNILELGEELTGDKQTQANKVFTQLESGITSSEGYRYWSKELINKLGIEGVSGDFFINIEKRNIVSYKGFEYKGKTYYTISQLPEGLYNVEYENDNTGKPTFDVGYEYIGNGKWRVTIYNIQFEQYINKWKVKYKRGQNNWKTSEDLSFVVQDLDNYKIKIINGNVESDEKEINIVNEPQLKDGMQAIIFTSDGIETVVTDTSKNDWYNYAAQTTATDTYNEETGEYGTSHWANAKLNDNYYVWIPRYAYKIYDTEGEEGYEKYTSQSGESYRIDVKFVGKDVTNENVEEKVGEGYIVHPAFLGTDTVMESGSSTGSVLGKELSGIWVGKYESSDDGSGNVKIIPNEISFTGIDVVTMFTKSQELSTENNNAHMLKNTEWGAVAYLAQSQYGRNGTEISVNECENKITGAGRGIGSETDNPIYNTTYSVNSTTNLPEEDQQYKRKIGKLSSTTGNIYGVYDMSGGGNERVAGCISEFENTKFGITTGDNTYVDLYINPSDYSSDYTGAITGDATNETAGWNGYASSFIYSYYPVFGRGGNYGMVGKGGIFCSGASDGDASDGCSFRVCLVVNE